MNSLGCILFEHCIGISGLKFGQLRLELQTYNIESYYGAHQQQLTSIQTTWTAFSLCMLLLLFSAVSTPATTFSPEPQTQSNTITTISCIYRAHIHSSVCLLGLSLVLLLLLLQCQSVIISTKGSLQFIIIMWTPSCQRQRLNANVSPPPQFLCCSRYWIHFSRPTTSLKTKGGHYFYSTTIIFPPVVVGHKQEMGMMRKKTKPVMGDHPNYYTGQELLLNMFNI